MARDIAQRAVIGIDQVRIVLTRGGFAVEEHSVARIFLLRRRMVNHDLMRMDPRMKHLPIAGAGQV